METMADKISIGAEFLLWLELSAVEVIDDIRDKEQNDYNLVQV